MNIFFKSPKINISILSKFKIGTKLIFLNSIMILSILLVGAIGYYYNNKSANNSNTIYAYMQPIQHMMDIQNHSKEIEENLMEMITTQDKAKFDKLSNNIFELNSAITKIMNEYEKKGLDSFEQKTMTLMNKNISISNDNINKCIGVLKKGNADQAYNLFESNRVFLKAFQTNVKNLTTYDIGLADNVNNQNRKSAQTAGFMLVIIFVSATLLSIFLGLTIAASIVNPLGKATKLINKTSELDLVDDPSFGYLLKNKDEIGTMVTAMANMRKALKYMAENIASISNKLTSHSQKLNSSTEENSQTISQVVATINEIAEANNSQSEAVTNTNERIVNVACKIDEMNSAMEESVGNASNSLEMVLLGQKAVDITVNQIKKNVRISQEVGESVDVLGGMIEKVGGIVNFITSIAGQTNLLALNAAIEAARAGEAGKGFAVVSDEIRKLAEGTANAAKEITSIIKDTIEKSRNVSESMQKVAATVDAQQESINNTQSAFENIKQSVERIVDKIRQSATMLKDIDGISKDISAQTQDMAAVSQQSAASMEEISASSEEQLASVEMTAQAAGELFRMAEELKLEICKFKT